MVKDQQHTCLPSILQEAGYKVGLYTSHLKDFRERIKIRDFPRICM
jgi:dihydrofolate synthase/folylpolyglutamate synthase